MKSQKSVKFMANHQKNDKKIQRKRSAHLNKNEILRNSKEYQSQSKYLKRINQEKGKSQLKEHQKSIRGQDIKLSDKLNKNSKTITNPLHMKDKIKHLIKRNQQNSNKHPSVVPDILKKIQKNCKILQGLHQKEMLSKDKIEINSKSKSKKLKQKISCSNTLKQDTKKITKTYQNSYLTQNVNKKFSLDTNIQRNKQKLPKKPKKQVINHSPNLIDITEVNIFQNKMLKNYKALIENEQIKIQTNDKTKYNTNQSRNSSSLYSHRYSTRMSAILNTIRVNQHNNHRFSNGEKINQLVLYQQKLLEVQTKGKANKPNEQFEFKQQKQQKELKNVSEQSQIELKYRSNNEKNYLKQQDSNKNPQHNKPFNIKNQVTFSKNQNDQQEIFQTKIKSILQRKFEKSKYYVQPMPQGKCLKSSKKLRQNENEDSLAGCQITLIEDNVIELSDIEDIGLQ